MTRKKFGAVALCVLLLLGLAFLLFRPRPIVENVNDCRIVMLRYNPYYGQNTDLDELIEITDYDAAAVLDCLARYTERRALGKPGGGFWTGNVQLDIVLDTEEGFKDLLLGKLNYSYQDIESPRYYIIDAKALIAELLTLVELDTQDDLPAA